MRKISMLSVVVFLLLAVPSFAQGYAKLEIFGGYNLVSISSHNDYGERIRTNMNGYNAAFTFNPTSVLGIKAEFAGVYNSTKLPEWSFYEGEVDVKHKLNFFSFMAGPQINVRVDGPVTPFGHFLVGVGKYSEKAEYDGSSFDIKDTYYPVAMGGGVDVSVRRNLAFRGQIDYFPWLRPDSGSIYKNIRITIGVVFRIKRNDPYL